MKTVILAGGFGTRISEESQFKPKPMIEIGEMPILWHIMKEYSFYGINDFIICAGYKQYIIKEFFSDYFLHVADVDFDFTDGGNKMTILKNRVENWTVTIVDTGLNTMTGGRIKRVQKYIGNEQFCLTYGDAVTDLNISELIKFHNSHGKCMTLTSVALFQQNNVIDIDNEGKIISLLGSNNKNDSRINGGYMVCNPSIFEYIENDSTVLEQEPMRRLVSEGELKSFYHNGFWMCMDTEREKNELERLWATGKAPWKVWKD